MSLKLQIFLRNNLHTSYLQIVYAEEYIAPMLTPVRNLKIINAQNQGANALAGPTIVCNIKLIINEVFRPCLSAYVPNIPEPHVIPNANIEYVSGRHKLLSQTRSHCQKYYEL